MGIAWVCSLTEPNFEPPLLKQELFTGHSNSDADKGSTTGQSEACRSFIPPLGARLAVIAHLLIRYHHEGSNAEPLSPRILLLALTLLGTHASHLTDMALEWHSTAKLRSSPVGHGTLLQCTLAALYAQSQLQARDMCTVPARPTHADAIHADADAATADASTPDATAPSARLGPADDPFAQQIMEAVARVARHIVHERCISASEDLKRIASRQ